jgi:DNA (cytosine-5)-methyltransferase 1
VRTPIFPKRYSALPFPASEKGWQGNPPWIIPIVLASTPLLSSNSIFNCLTFAGKGKAENDDRYLWHEFARLVKEIRPRWVVGENVPGILNRGLETTVSDLEKEDYEVWVFRILPGRTLPCLPFASEGASGRILLYDWLAVGVASNDKEPLSFVDGSPGICRVDDGVSRELDKNRLIALGNAVQPQQVYPIFKAIMEIENGS